MVKRQEQTSIYKWIWHAYLKTALIPVVIVELIFVISYYATISWSQVYTINYLKSEEISEMQQMLDDRTESIQQQLTTVSYAVDFLSLQFQRALAEDTSLQEEDAERLTFSPEGVYCTKENKESDGAAIFYSGIYPIGEKEIEKVAKVLTVENIMKDIVNTVGLASQVYMNTYDSLNIIYPYFDVISQYAPKMDIPSFNFYYEADAEHNPDRSVTWTEAYLDPAGMGWMASAIMPVYQDDFLEGVVGIDITISTITDKVLNMNIPWNGYGMLVGADGTILALPKMGEEEWGLIELTDHTYSEAIQKDTYKPEQFNIYNHGELTEITQELEENETGYKEILFSKEQKIVAWSTIEETGWKLIVIIPEANIYANVNDMKETLLRAGTIIIISGVCFYLVFFYVLSLKARKMSLNMSKPLIRMNDMVKEIGNGNYYHEVPDIQVKELHETAEFLTEMGNELGNSNAQLLDIQKELRLREAFLSAIVESVDDIIIVTDEEGNIKNEWKASQHIPGKDGSRTNLSSIEHFIGADEYQKIIKHIKRTNVTERVEFSLGEQPDIYWYQAIISQIEGKTPLFVISARDITENKKLESSLVLAKEEAERASMAKSQFLSSMSHELRTPLNAIIGFSQILLSDQEEPLSGEQENSVSEILKAGHHLLNLINEVLDLARIESGRMTMSMEPVRVFDIVKEVTALMMPLAEQYKIKLITDQNIPKKLMIHADLTRTKQVLVNLLTNALKYNKKDGKVYLYIEEIENHIRFNIKDTGVGIREEDMALLFQPFQRLDFKNSVTIEGTGIGLSVAKKMTEMMKGKIGVQSTWGEGSLFYVDFEKEQEDRMNNQIHMSDYEYSEEDYQSESLSIVYIEDNPANMALLKKFMSKMPNTILYTADCGEDGIELANQERPDLILLDMNLPDMDGKTVFIQLKQLENTKDIPVIALSANAMYDDIRSALKIGISDYLVKPIDLKELTEKLNGIRRRKLEME